MTQQEPHQLIFGSTLNREFERFREKTPNQPTNNHSIINMKGRNMKKIRGNLAISRNYDFNFAEIAQKLKRL